MTDREFAIQVARTLTDAGYTAFWAGGCVRDALFGIEPKDYDVATDAQPRQVRDVFGEKRTRMVGAAFGVVLVHGPRGVSPIEVATFREDGVYSDGRRPDRVSFSTPERDAQRRDFTLNGLFYDPLQNEVIDYVGGRSDLEAGIVRAIGDPLKRIAEDKLRMVRAVRFSARFDFELEAATLAAIQNQAATLSAVSAERISGELQRMLTHANRVRAVELLRETQLWRVIFPEAATESNAELELQLLRRMPANNFAAAMAALLRSVYAQQHKAVQTICRRLRFSNDVRSRIGAMLADEQTLRNASDSDWPTAQRCMVKEYLEERLQFAEAVCAVHGQDDAGVTFCRHKLSLGESVWNPPPLLTGDDLIAGGMKPGRHIRDILNAVRNAQLNGEITTPEQALELAKTLKN